MRVDALADPMNRLLLALPFLSTSLVAQQVSITFTTVTPLVTRAYSSTFNLLQSQSVPANQVGPQWLQTNVMGAQADSEYGIGGNGTTWHLRTECFEVAPSFAEASGEVLIHVTATSPVQASVELLHQLLLTAGSAAPAFRMDFGDDGTFEVTESSIGPVVHGALLGPTPLPIRVRASLLKVGNGTIDLALGIAVTPETAQVNSLAGGCAPASLFAYPVFAGSGVEFTVLAPGPIVLVLGLSLQPQPLPLAIASSCVLLPAPDLLVPMVAPPLPYFTLPLPAAVRPVTLFAQGVLVSAAGLGTTNSFSIVAF